jgi:hypothetical protein
MISPASPCLIETKQDLLPSHRSAMSLIATYGNHVTTNLEANSTRVWTNRIFVFRICRCQNATIQQLLTGTTHYQNGIIIYLPESQVNCGSGGMLLTATRAQMAPPHGYRQPSVSGSIWSSPGAYGRLLLLLFDISTSSKDLDHADGNFECRGADASCVIVGDDSKVICLNGSRAPHGVAQVVIHSLVAFQ